MNKAYVSDFTNFMDQYLKEHPKVVEEQRRGWGSFWNLKIDPATLNFCKEDIVQDDHYGFY